MRPQSLSVIAMKCCTLQLPHLFSPLWSIQTEGGVGQGKTIIIHLSGLSHVFSLKRRSVCFAKRLSRKIHRFLIGLRGACL